MAQPLHLGLGSRANCGILAMQKFVHQAHLYYTDLKRARGRRAGQLPPRGHDMLDYTTHHGARIAVPGVAPNTAPREIRQGGS